MPNSAPHLAATPLEPPRPFPPRSVHAIQFFERLWLGSNLTWQSNSCFGCRHYAVEGKSDDSKQLEDAFFEYLEELAVSVRSQWSDVQSSLGGAPIPQFVEAQRQKRCAQAAGVDSLVLLAPESKTYVCIQQFGRLTGVTGLIILSGLKRGKNSLLCRAEQLFHEYIGKQRVLEEQLKTSEPMLWRQVSLKRASRSCALCVPISNIHPRPAPTVSIQ